MSSRASRTIYVGNLPGDVREREIEDLFYKYGRIVDIDLKLPPRPPGYCFIEFEDARDAEDAIRGRDGYNFDGNRLRVELAHGGRGPPSSVDRYNTYAGGSGGASRGLDAGRTGGVSRRSEYRVIVTGLPSSASWQDLKDHMRRAGDVCFAQVFRDGNGNYRPAVGHSTHVCFSTPRACLRTPPGTMGIVDFTNYDDMKYAVKEDKGYGFRRSASRSASRSRSRSPVRTRTASKSPQSRSASRSASHSRSRSRSQRRSLSAYKERSRSASLSPSASRSPIRTRSSSHPPRSRSTSPKAKEKVSNSSFGAAPHQ